jgi:hypothetical protein
VKSSFSEVREIKASKQFYVTNGRNWVQNERIKVIAERFDADTPFVHVFLGLETGSRVLTDTETRDLIDRLTRALDALPTSK